MFASWLEARSSFLCRWVRWPLEGWSTIGIGVAQSSHSDTVSPNSGGQFFSARNFSSTRLYRDSAKLVDAAPKMATESEWPRRGLLYVELLLYNSKVLRVRPGVSVGWRRFLESCGTDSRSDPGSVAAIICRSANLSQHEERKNHHHHHHRKSDLREITPSPSLLLARLVLVQLGCVVVLPGHPSFERKHPAINAWLQ